MMEVIAHAVHPDGSSPTKFAVDGESIESFCLPVFELVDRSAGIEITPPQPAVFSSPLLCLCYGPTVRNGFSFFSFFCCLLAGCKKE
jgi:hypothetical protein